MNLNAKQIIQYIKGKPSDKSNDRSVMAETNSVFLFLLNKEKCSQAAHNNNICSY